ncbi:MAG: four helix bundle protein [Ktedonobacterales bacterium]
MNAKESPIFVKLFDFVAWVIPLTTKFPREQRFVVAERLQRVALGAHEAAIRAGMQSTPQAILAQLDEVAVHLALTRFYLRLAQRFTFITVKQYEYATDCLIEIGRLLRAWQRSSQPRGAMCETGAQPALSSVAIPGAVTL